MRQKRHTPRSVTCGGSKRPWLLGLLRALHDVTDLELCIGDNWDVALDVLSDFDEDDEEDVKGLREDSASHASLGCVSATDRQPTGM